MTWAFGLSLLLIFCARLVDVTLGVFRILMVVHGRRLLAAVLGFFEVMVFLFTMSLILGGGKTLTLPELFAYCGGYAGGNILGSFLEHKLMNSYAMVEIIAEKNAGSSAMVNELRDAGLGVTVIAGEGRTGERLDIKVICSRKQIARVETISRPHGAFMFVSDVKGVSGGYFLTTRHH
ncbi:MAG: DUF5698 domain-containing protein [Planctomycetota bacterium]|jgi:uncharacterized protein YebE (UPF0316 family)|nr:DUF5698 domain-containing protein [Planctomycetota bacterium]